MYIQVIARVLSLGGGKDQKLHDLPHAQQLLGRSNPLIYSPRTLRMHAWGRWGKTLIGA